jgi:ssDNA-binding Zn-finger/Zn-ribbon topoisomerase 1
MNGESHPQRVPIQPPIPCPECGGSLILRPSRFGLFYGCQNYPECRATHGAHPYGRPLGTPADKATKLARIAAHDVFDRLWKARDGERAPLTRKQAYGVLQKVMGMTRDEAHIGRFSAEQCREAEEKLTDWLYAHNLIEL